MAALATRPVLATLLAVNILVAIIASVWIVAADGFTWTGVLLDGVGPVQLAGELNGPAIDDGEVWRVLSSSFVHYGVLHLLANMTMLALAGWWLEPWMGSRRFALLYLVSALASGAASYLVFHDELTAGASGANFGLFAALLVLALRRSRRVRLAIGLLVFGIVTTFVIPGLAIAAHAAGLAAGLAAVGVHIQRPERQIAAGATVTQG